MLQAVIMAAGRSTRTTPLTDTRPKPLIPIWGEPHLAHQLRQLSGWIAEAIVVVGYEREQIQSVFGSSFANVRLRYAVQETARGTADALLTARPHINSDFMVLNGDDFYHRDDLKLLSRHESAVLVCEAPDPQNRSVIQRDGDRVTDIVEKPSAPEPDALCGVGAYRFRSGDLHLLDSLPLSPRGELELPDFVSRIIETTHMGYQQVTRFWLPLTYAWDPIAVMLYLWEIPKRAGLFGLSEKNDAPQRGVRIEGPVWLGENLRIGDDVEIIGPTVIGRGGTIEAGARIERSVLFESVRVGRRSSVSYSVLGAGTTLGDQATLASAPGQRLSVSVKGTPTVPRIERFGCAIGDGARIGSNQEIPPGSILPPGTEVPVIRNLRKNH